MSAVIQFYQLTLELIELLEKSAEERETKISQIERLLTQREALMTEIAPPYASNEIEVGKRLLALNEKVAQLLQGEKTHIQKDIKDLQTKKESNAKYANPYQNLSTDGMFYDKKK